MRNAIRGFPHRVAALLGVALLLSCASNPPVQLAVASKSEFDGAVYPGETTQLEKATPGAEAYRAFYQGGSGFVSISSVRSTVEDMASRHCARQGKQPRPLQETVAKAPFILGNFPRVEWLFECAEKPGAETSSTGSDRLAQLERLKKLLDSGALTQQEYDREKARILSGK